MSTPDGASGVESSRSTAEHTLPSPPEPTALLPETAESTSPPPKPKRRRHWIWVCLALLVLLIAARLLWPKAAASSATTSGRGAGGATAPVVTATARKGDINVYYSSLGAVTPLATVTVKTRVDGELIAVDYREGQLVHTGDVLAKLDDRPFRAALEQAEGQLARDQAQLDNARIDLTRYQGLLPQKAVPEQQVATQLATVHQDEGIVKLDQGIVDNANVNLVYTTITSPITGRVGLRLVDIGNVVHASDQNGIAVITQMDPMSVIFFIAEDQVQTLRQAMAAGPALEVDAFDRQAKTKRAQGTLTTLDNQIDPTTGTLKLRATFANANSALFPNEFVNARLLVQVKRGVTLAPAAAIQRNAQSTYAYVVKPDSTVTIRTVAIGTTEGDDAEVTSGLAPGDVIVLSGVDKLQEGSHVTIAKPASAAPAAPAAPAQPAAAKRGRGRST